VVNCERIMLLHQAVMLLLQAVMLRPGMTALAPHPAKLMLSAPRICLCQTQKVSAKSAPNQCQTRTSVPNQCRIMSEKVYGVENVAAALIGEAHNMV